MSAPTGEKLLNARSDDLASFSERLGDRAELRHLLGPLERFVFIVDTNRVLADLGWLVARRRNPAARTALQELHASGVATFFAPEHLLAEVNEHLPEIAEHYGVPDEALRAAWAEYRPIIHVIPAAHLGQRVSDHGARDPKDVLPDVNLISPLTTTTLPHRLSLGVATRP